MNLPVSFAVLYVHFPFFWSVCFTIFPERKQACDIPTLLLQVGLGFGGPSCVHIHKELMHLRLCRLAFFLQALSLLLHQVFGLYLSLHHFIAFLSAQSFAHVSPTISFPLDAFTVALHFNLQLDKSRLVLIWGLHLYFLYSKTVKKYEEEGLSPRSAGLCMPSFSQSPSSYQSSSSSS